MRSSTSSAAKWRSLSLRGGTSFPLFPKWSYFPTHLSHTLLSTSPIKMKFSNPFWRWLVIDRFSYLPVFVGFGLMPLICTAILWTLLGPIAPLSRAVDFNSAS
jgi:hypothetical protein